MDGLTPTELRSRRKKRLEIDKSASRKVLAGFGELLIIVLSILLLAVIAGGIYATDYMTGVLRELETNDYAAPQVRISEYEAYFQRLSQQGYLVVPSEPMLREGEIYYLWTVTPPYSSDNIVYRWKVSFESNEVTPLTKAAEQLDRELGFS